MKLADRFWSKVAPPNARGCRVWTGAKVRGYGNVGYKGRTRIAHRVAYELAIGPIPPGLCVCHRCDVRACCEPSHLFLGTQAENRADCVAKGRQARGERNGAAKLTDPSVAEIRASSESQRALARRFGVGKSTIGRIHRREAWNEGGRGGEESKG